MADPVATHSPCLGVRQSFLGRFWHSPDIDSQAVQAMRQATDLPESIVRILVGRGHSLDTVETFLNPTLRQLMPDPLCLTDMDKAVARLQSAIEKNERITVFGDYDVDGATSSALLIRFFRALGIDVASYIPDRLKEGYGPNTEALEGLAADGVTLVITVDCGITAYGPLAQAASIGLDVIVIDHHKAEPQLPEAVAIVNPNRLDDTSGLGHLAAIGVTFLVLVALNRALRDSGWYKDSAVVEPDLRHWLDLVALGTVCDVVPLRGLNRAYVTQGLTMLKRSQNAGINALAEAARMDGPPKAFHLGFLLGPRVNAGGRVGEASLGTRLLTCDDPDEAAALAMRLDEYNTNRKDIEAAVLLDAIEMAEAQSDPSASMIFAVGQDWHPGVIGIVASRLRERYDLPACVVAMDGGMAKGSGRSVPGVDLGRAVLAARDKGLLFSGGGHAMAAGFVVEEANLAGFQTFLSDQIKDQIASGGAPSMSGVDAVVSVEAATLDLVRDLSRLEPYGTANEEPKIAVSEAHVVQSDIVGQGHVRCLLSGRSGGRLKAIAFNSADSELGHALLNAQGRPVHLLGSLREDTWQGRSSVQLVIDDGSWVGA